MMRTILLITIFILSNTLGRAQTTFGLTPDNEKIEAKAKELTKKYNEQLALRAKEYLLFQKKIEEYLHLAEDIKENYKGTEMLDRLYILQEEEIGEMHNILTRIQWNLYKKIRPEIQPLARVEIDK